MNDLSNPFAALHQEITLVRELLSELMSKLDSEPKSQIPEWSHNGIELAMSLTGYSKHTIYQLVNQRQIPHSKHRNKLRFDADEIKEWMKGAKREIDTASKRNRTR